MNPEIESHAWLRLRQYGAAQLRPGFADRVLRAVRTGVESMPSLFHQFLVGVATAAACAGVVIVVHMRSTQSADDRSLADWQQIASTAPDPLQVQ